MVYIFIFPLFLSFAASTDSPAATVDSETITLNSGTLQTFEILPVSKRELIFVAVVFSLKHSYFLDYGTVHFPKKSVLKWKVEVKISKT